MNSVDAMALAILAPLFAAALSFAWPRAGRWFAIAAAGAVALGAMTLARQVMSAGVQRHRVGDWAAPLGIELRADGLATLMLIIAAVIGTAITIYAPHYFSCASYGHKSESAHQERYFWPLWLFLWTALNALFLSADIFNLYVTLELLGFAAVMLVALAGQASAFTAAMRYLFVSLTGSLFYLLGVGLIYGAYATVDLSLLSGLIKPTSVTWTALALMTVGLLMKTALFPMHFWLPPAHANAPAPVSALLSALVVKGGFCILLRLWFEAYGATATPGAAQLLGAFGAAAVFWGSLQALLQARLKMLVAYSTVCQLGYLFLIYPLAWQQQEGFTAWSGGLIFLTAHACGKTAMFLTAGNIMMAAGHDRIRDLDGITHVLPVSVFAFALAGISLAAIPPSSGFMGKWLLLNAALSHGQWLWAVVMVLGGLLAAAYVMRVLSHAFTRDKEPPALQPISPVMEWTAFTLALLAVLLGFASSWPAELLRAGAPLGGPLLSGGGGL
ncbi:MAG: complex I subunit 5 family protein [Alphaproteobacteria bacterium]